jgi:hypothetical protein
LTSRSISSKISLIPRDVKILNILKNDLDKVALLLLGLRFGMFYS